MIHDRLNYQFKAAPRYGAVLKENESRFTEMELTAIQAVESARNRRRSAHHGFTTGRPRHRFRCRTARDLALAPADSYLFGGLCGIHELGSVTSESHAPPDSLCQQLRVPAAPAATASQLERLTLSISRF